MLTLDIVSREFAHADGATRPPYRNKRHDSRLQKAKENKINYRKRKASGFCSRGNCPAKAEVGRTQCRMHLEEMAAHAKNRQRELLAQNLCLYCGRRPQFWGLKCIICRQIFARDPLPKGARRALRNYREAEARHRKENIQGDAREAVFGFLASGQIKGKRAEALRLYAGVDTGNWRTYKEVGKIMNLTGERVRQLLLPAKLSLKATFSGPVPWRPVEGQELNRADKTVPPQNATRTSRKVSCLRILDKEAYPYEGSDLRNVILFGLTVDRENETASIPAVDDLHRKLAKALLLKPMALTGSELRFLRSTAGLAPSVLAEKLDITFQSVLAWERSKELRRPNDLAARMIIASEILPDECGSQVVELLRAIREPRSKVARMHAYWINDQYEWIVTLPLNRETENPTF